MNKPALSIESDALHADGDLGESRPHLGVEAFAVHAEIVRRVAQTNEARSVI